MDEPTLAEMREAVQYALENVDWDHPVYTPPQRHKRALRAVLRLLDGRIAALQAQLDARDAETD